MGGPNPAVRLRPDFPRVRARDAITRYARTAPKSFTTSHPLSRPHPASVYAARAHRIFTRPRDAVQCLDSRTRLLTDRATVRLRRDRDGAGPAPGRQHATRPKAPPRPRPRGGAPVPLAVALRTGRDWRPHRHLTATALPRLRTSRGHGHDPRGTAHTHTDHSDRRRTHGTQVPHSDTVVRHGPRRATTHGVPPTHDVPPRATAEIPPR